MTLERHDLSVRELMLFNSEMKHAGKSPGVAYLMLLGGHFGLHRFYLGRKRSAAAQLTLFAAAVLFYVAMALVSAAAGTESSGPFVLTAFLFGLFALALLVWIVVDLFRLPGMIRSFNDGIERELLAQIEHFQKMEQLAGRGGRDQSPQTF